MSILSETLGLLGGVSVILTALFGILGKIWITRIADKEKGRIQEGLETLKGEIEQSNKMFQAILEKSIFVNKVQFEHEFKIYREVWEKLIELRYNTMRLRPILDTVDPSEPEEQIIKKRLTRFGEAAEAYRDVIEKNRPFYAEGVYTHLSDVLDKCHTESIDYQYKQRDLKDYWESAQKNRNEIIDSIEKSCTSIRSRINDLSAVPL